MIMAVVGGTVSKLTGGKFANGAVSGAFVHLFNAEGVVKSISVLKKIKKIFGSYDKLDNGAEMLKITKEGFKALEEWRDYEYTRGLRSSAEINLQYEVWRKEWEDTTQMYLHKWAIRR
jgi:hypothetical protein